MSKEDSEHTAAERITMGISIVILAAIIGLAGWASYSTGDSSPVIEVEAHMSEIRETDDGFYVPITITNNGGFTAQSVMVTGELLIEGEEPETAEVTIDFLAGGETEGAALVFSTNPNNGEFTVAPTSYLQP